ncbi:MAG: cobalamin biosynthesis protein [Elusimicrobia bacterium RIFOXYD2_FULL_34_15]|nr:MAG: cobalamin biosynthesis protein [Elusimicrobia bacterium RIFOXYD2_FULL_34_15]
MKITTKLWIGIGILIILSPLGLIIPEYFKSGNAWGEWSSNELQKLIGYVPKGLKELSSLWNAPMSEYTIKGWGEKGPKHLSFTYIISAITGILIITSVIFIIGKLLVKKGNK